MKPETAEWVQKAEGDINTAQREFARGTQWPKNKKRIISRRSQASTS